MFVCLFVCLFIYLYILTYLFINLFIYLFICLIACLFVSLFVCVPQDNFAMRIAFIFPKTLTTVLLILVKMAEAVMMVSTITRARVQWVMMEGIAQ